jgi:hypothetical protein
MCVEANACKPMHIPEYILAAWLLHHAPVLGCKGRGFQIVDGQFQEIRVIRVNSRSKY